MDIGSKIRQIRKENHMSQEQFAQEFHVTRQTVSNWENNKNYPDMETIRAISVKYQISFDTLLKDDIELLNEIDQTKKKAVIWKKKYMIALVVMILALGLCMILGYELNRKTKFGTNPEEWIEEVEYPLEKQDIADVIVECGFAERNWTINQNDTVRFEGEESASFTILSEHQHIRFGHVMGILSRKLGEERTLGLNIDSLDENVAILREECEEAIIFGTRLFGGYSSETRVAEAFMKEFDVEEAIQWEKEIEGNICQIRYDPDGYGCKLVISFLSDAELLKPRERVVSKEQEDILEFTPGYRIEGLGEELFYDGMPKLRTTIQCEYSESGAEQYEIGEIYLLEN